MSKKLLFRLAVLVAAMMCALGASAAEFEAYACYTSGNTTLTFYYDDQRSSRSGTTYDLNTGKNIPGWLTDGVYKNVTDVVFDPAFTLARPTTTYMWFDGMLELQYIDCLRYLNTSEVTDMERMFHNCDNLQYLDGIYNFDTRNVTDMGYMFGGCSDLESLDLSHFNTAKVTDMTGMFHGCSDLESLDLSHFNTANVTNMSRMFTWCRNLTSLDLSHFNTAKVPDMTGMFYECSYLESLDLSSFNTANVTDMSYMFNSCYELRTIYVGSGWSTDAVSNSTSMFHGCYELVGGKGTTYDEYNPHDKTYAHIDGGPSNPGYFHEAKAYACYTPENTTLTFYYDRQREIRPGTTYDLNTGSAIPGWEANGTNANVTQVVFDPSFASARPTSTYDWFGEMQGVVSITGIDYLNTSEVTNMAYMFYGCTGLRSLDLSGFNTSKVTDMNSMFNHCNSLTSLDLSSFNTARVTDMSMMFQTCLNLVTIYVGSGWTTAAVTSSDNMFYYSTRIVGGQGTTYDYTHVDKTYAHIDGGTSNPGYFTDIQVAMQPYVALSEDGQTLTFYKDGKIATHTEPTFLLNEPGQTPGWNIYSNVTTVVFDPSFAPVRPTYMGDWFNGMRYLTSIQGIENLNTSEVTDMNSLFLGCTSLVNVDLQHFDTGNVTGMNSMFSDCSSLRQLDLSNFDTRNVTDMNSMFRGCTNLESLDLPSFDTRKVTDMNGMFRGCTNLESLDLSSFDTHSVTRMIWMFYNCSNLTTIYAGSNWDTAGVTSSSSMFANCTSLMGGQGTAYNDSNPKDKTYAHIDGGTSNPGYFTRDPNSPEPYACYTPSNTTLTFYYDNQRNTRPGITFSIYEGMVDPEWYEDGYSYDVTKVVFNPSFASARPTSTQNWFAEMQNLTSIEGIQYLNTSEVTTMSGMFWECTELTAVDVSGFDTRKVTDMSWMFSECYELNGLDVSGWNTSNVTTMQGLFGNCSSLTSLDVSHFNTSNVTNMSQLFDGCSGLTSLDVSNFDTSNVTDMSYMFNWCKGLQQLDLSVFNTSKVTNMSCMFNESSNLRTIYVGDGWTTAAVTSSSYMFDVCTSLVGGKGTTYNANHVDAAYAHIDGGTSNPGYFSEKGGAFTRGDVNGNNEVTIADVSALIDYLLTGDPTGVNLAAADCNGIDGVTIADVSALIDYLLTGSW